MKTIVLLISVSLTGVLVNAQTADPLSAGNKGVYNIAKGNLIKAAEKMPEENYGFKPTPEVRSFGQIVGHAGRCRLSRHAITMEPGGGYKARRYVISTSSSQ